MKSRVPEAVFKALVIALGTELFWWIRVYFSRPNTQAGRVVGINNPSRSITNFAGNLGRSIVRAWFRKRSFNTAVGTFNTAVGTLLLLAAAGCAKPAQDAQVIGDVVTRIHADSKIKNKNIVVMSKQGVVTLSGSAANAAERTEILTTAAQVPGVRIIVNDLVVDAPAEQASVVQWSPEPILYPIRPRVVAAKPSAQRPVQYVSAHESSAIPKTQTAAVNPSATATPAKVNDDKTVSTPPATSQPTQATVVPVSATGLPPLPQQESRPAVTAPAPATRQVSIESGTPLYIRMVDSVDTDRSQVGDTFRATLDAPVYSGDEMLIPEGTAVVGRVVDLQDAGRFSGRPQLALELSSISLNGRQYSLHTNQYTKQGGSQGARTAKSMGGGAALGAILGAIAGGGRGAAIGAAVGAGAGGGVEAVRHAQQVSVNSEARLNFRLESPLRMTTSPAAAHSYDNEGSTDIAQTQVRDTTSTQQIVNDVDNNEEDPGEYRPVLKRRPPATPDQPN
jgi:BON domain-containing protein